MIQMRDFFWPNLQLKTCEVKCLASNCWLSDLIMYRIAQLINKSNPDTYAFNYTFVSDIRHVIQRIHVKHTDVMPKKIIFAINVGKWNGNTYLARPSLAKTLYVDAISLWVYTTQSKTSCFMGIPKGGQCPKA